MRTVLSEEKAVLERIHHEPLFTGHVCSHSYHWNDCLESADLFFFVPSSEGRYSDTFDRELLAR